MDPTGNVYVKELGNNRVQKLDSAGRFVLMFGGGVNKTTSANLCTAASGNECGKGTSGVAPGQFSGGRGITLGPGTVFVADEERIQRFSEEGVFVEAIPVADATVGELARDPLSGDFYTILDVENGSKPDVRRIDADTGAEVDKLEETSRGGVATGPAGNVFGVGSADPNRVFEFDPAGTKTSEFATVEALPPPNSVNHFRITGLGASDLGTVYVVNSFPGVGSYIRVFGPPPVAFEAPPPAPPEIDAQFASSVLRDEAILVADINPHFWTNTKYYVQYGTGKCSEGGCGEEKPTAPGAILSPRISGRALRSAGIVLEGLEPGTTYHYRFVAESAGGGPAVGPEKTFTTYAESLAHPPCANESLRSGTGAKLPDCRAYEMVSPVDKNNGDIKSLRDDPEYFTDLSQSAPDGNRFTYSSYRSFGNPEGAPFTSQYIASRDATSGWASDALSAPQGPATGLVLENQYKAFSDDLCDGWLVWIADAPLPPPGTEGYANVYRRDTCGKEGYEALVHTQPTLGPEFLLELQGSTVDGKAAIIRANDKLTPEAASGVYQAYYASGGDLQLACILPDGTPYPSNCTAGMARNGDSSLGYAIADLNRTASVTGAFSGDGSRLYWTASEATSGVGKIYLRVNPGKGQSAIAGGACIEPDKACTTKVSETKSNRASRFLLGSPDGSKALFEVVEGPSAGKLFEFEVGSGSTEVAGGLVGLVGASKDLSRIYLVSEEALASGAAPGKPNLYLSEGGTVSFITTLADTDVHGIQFPSNASPENVFQVARVSSDGSAVAFVSSGQPTGYDNTDLQSPPEAGEALSEVYVYRAGSTGPLCVSCNPSEARPTGQQVQGNATHDKFATAGSIPPGHYQFYLSRALSADGSRLFFNSYDSLLLGDTNGAEDVYEWEAAPNQGACAQMGAELYVAKAGGCLSLISTGQSPEDSEFLDASSSGNDVFFTTSARLVPRDPGLIDAYDARVGGGISEPGIAPSCQGEACQPVVLPPSSQRPASADYKGPGNVKEKSKKKSKKKHHKKKNKKKHHKHGRSGR